MTIACFVIKSNEIISTLKKSNMYYLTLKNYTGYNTISFLKRDKKVPKYSSVLYNYVKKTSLH